jgi:hypothetical protein
MHDRATLTGYEHRSVGGDVGGSVSGGVDAVRCVGLVHLAPALLVEPQDLLTPKDNHGRETQ